MDDKTAAIPSLKEFKEKQKDRSAQSRRTGSMQTKGQLKKSTQAAKNSGAKSQPPRKKISASADTMRVDSKKIRSESQKSRSTANSNTRSKPAPSSYARERINSSKTSDYDNSRRIDRNAQSQRRDNQHSASSKASSSRGRGASQPAPSRERTMERTPRQSSTSNRPPQQRGASAHPQSKAVSRQNTVSNRTPAKKKRKPMNRRMRNIIYIITMLLVVLIVGTVLSLTVFFKTESFEVYGIDRYTKKEIVDASGLSLGDNIITARKKQAEERIERIYPYVEDAEVYSIFPNSIGINLTMAKPACKINAIGGCYIVSNKGKVLEVTSSADEVDVPLIEGIQIKGRAEGEYVDYGSDTLANALYEMFCAFESMQSTRITGINIVAKENIFELRYVYDDRIIVQLGLPEELTYKLTAADKVIEKLDAEDGTAIAGELDVSTCHETGRSYFNQYSILSPDVAPPVSTTAPTEPLEDSYY